MWLFHILQWLFSVSFYFASFRFVFFLFKFIFFYLVIRCCIYVIYISVLTAYPDDQLNVEEIYGSTIVYSLNVCSSVEHSVKRSMQIIRYAIETYSQYRWLGFIHFTSLHSMMMMMMTMAVGEDEDDACIHSLYNHSVGLSVLVCFSPAVLNRLHRMNIWRRCLVCQLNCSLCFVCSFYYHLPTCRVHTCVCARVCVWLHFAVD